MDFFGTNSFSSCTTDFAFSLFFFVELVEELETPPKFKFKTPQKLPDLTRQTLSKLLDIRPSSWSRSWKLHQNCRSNFGPGIFKSYEPTTISNTDKKSCFLSLFHFSFRIFLPDSLEEIKPSSIVILHTQRAISSVTTVACRIIRLVLSPRVRWHGKIAGWGC